MNNLTWLYGVLLNATGSFLINYGTNVIRYSHIAVSYTQNMTIHRANVLFVVGWIIFVLGNISNFVSFSLATQTILASLGSLQFVFNLISAYLLFRQKPTKRQISGTCCVIIGIISIILAAENQTEEYDSDELKKMFVADSYIAYIITMGSVSLMFQLSLWFIDYKSNRLSNQQRAKFYRIESTKSNTDNLEENIDHDTACTGTDKDGNELHRKQSLQTQLLQKFTLMSPLSYSVVSTAIGSQAVLLAKSSSMLIIESLNSTNPQQNQFLKFESYLFIVGWVGTMIFWLVRMNRALKKYDGDIMIPMLQVQWILFSIVSGGLFFGEFEKYYWFNWAGFIAGVTIVFIGVCVLAPSAKHETVDEIKKVTNKLDGSNESLIQLAVAASSGEPSVPERIKITPEPKHNETLDDVNAAIVPSKLSHLKSNEVQLTMTAESKANFHNKLANLSELALEIDDELDVHDHDAASSGRSKGSELSPAIANVTPSAQINEIDSIVDFWQNRDKLMQTTLLAQNDPQALQSITEDSPNKKNIPLQQDDPNILSLTSAKQHELELIKTQPRKTTIKIFSKFFGKSVKLLTKITRCANPRVNLCCPALPELPPTETAKRYLNKLQEIYVVTNIGRESRRWLERRSELTENQAKIGLTPAISLPPVLSPELQEAVNYLDNKISNIKISSENHLASPDQIIQQATL